MWNWAGQATASRPLGPHSCIDKPGGMVGGAKQTAQPRAPAWGNKASNLQLKTPMGVEEAAGETPRLTGEFIGETYRGLERTQTPHSGNSKCKGPDARIGRACLRTGKRPLGLLLYELERGEGIGSKRQTHTHCEHVQNLGVQN